MSTDTTLLKELLRQRHLKYETFRVEYERVAGQIAADGVAPSKAQYYRWLSGQLRGGLPYPDACRVLESMFSPWKAADLLGPYRPGRHLLDGGGTDVPGTVLGQVPHGFRVGALSGHWVTCYQFHHGGQGGTPQHHADIAHVTAESDRRICAVNHPPQPRTEGRANPFRNQIEAELASRHLIGHWKNTSDTRYFGSVHLAVLPGETVMDGYYTGVGSDIEVSVARWKWVRLESGSLEGARLQEIVLREPSALHDLVMSRSQFDAPLTLADVREEPR
jgi:hypothetical protein